MTLASNAKRGDLLTLFNRFWRASDSDSCLAIAQVAFETGEDRTLAAFEQHYPGKAKILEEYRKAVKPSAQEIFVKSMTLAPPER